MLCPTHPAHPAAPHTLARPGWRTALCAVAALLLTACAAPPPTPGFQGALGAAQLPAGVQAALAQQQLPAEALAFVAFPLDTPAQGAHWQADRSMAPGSTMKLLTSAVALDQLGPNWRGRTELLAGGPLKDGVLDGPLVLKGGADATLDWGALAQLLRQAREAGVQRVQGGLRIDRSLFRPARPDLGQAPFDESPEFPYNTLPDALFLNQGLLTLELRGPASADGPVQARWLPTWPGLVVQAEAMKPVERACAQWEQGWKPPQVSASPGQWQLQLQGEFPLRCVVQQNLNSLARDAVALQAVRQLWTELGGQWSGEFSEGEAPAGSQPLAQHLAPPLGEWWRGAMKRSDNPLTRLLYLRLGSAHPDVARFERTQDAAADLVQRWLAARGIASEGLVLDNGSGLSRSERMSPRLLAGLLQAVQREAYAPEFESGLPLAGVDGTLSRRLKGSAAEGRARLKTGTLRDAVGLAGYVLDANDRRWVVAAFVNHPTAGRTGRAVLDALMIHLAGSR